jgi:dolichol-phosphate mannosyltransferase
MRMCYILLDKFYIFIYTPAVISVVIPIHNEQSCLNILAQRLFALQADGDEKYEYIFIDDGSTDNSLGILKELQQQNSNLKYISFSRNFGHEAATTAGLDHACGDAVVIIDADLQDPPELIPRLIEKWKQGNQIVYARRRRRKGEKPSVKLTSWLFYRIINWLSDVKIPVDTGDFRLMDRCVVEQFIRCREQSRFLRGLVAWLGFKHAAILYDRDQRYAGATKYSGIKRILLALDAVVGFSPIPLRVGLVLGMIVCIFSFSAMSWIVLKKILWGIPVKGYALLTGGLFLLGGVQLLLIGLMGEYIGRIYRQTQSRPLYVIAEKSKSIKTSAQDRDGS